MVAKWRAKNKSYSMSVKDATMHEKRTTVQNLAEFG